MVHPDLPHRWWEDRVIEEMIDAYIDFILRKGKMSGAFGLLRYHVSNHLCPGYQGITRRYGVWK